MKTLLQYFSIKNFYRNPLSTLIGCLVLFFTLYRISIDKATYTETTGLIIFILTAFFFGKNNSQPPQIPMSSVLFISFLFLFGCNSFKKLPKSQIDTVRIVYEKTIPKDSVSIRFVTDTIHHTITEKQGRATLIIEKHKEFIRASAICDTIRIKDTLKILTEKVVYQYPKEKKGFFGENWIWVYGAILLAIIALAVIFRKFKNS